MSTRSTRSVSVSVSVSVYLDLHLLVVNTIFQDINEVNEVNAGNALDDRPWSDSDDLSEVTDSSSEDSEEEEVSYEQGQHPQPHPPPPPAPPEELAEQEKAFRDTEVEFFLELAAKFSLSGAAMDSVANHLIWARKQRAELISRGIRDFRGQPEGERQLYEDFAGLYLGLESVIGMDRQLTSKHRRNNVFSEKYEVIYPDEVCMYVCMYVYLSSL